MCNSKMDGIKWQQPLQLVGSHARVVLFCQRSCERKWRSCERTFTRGFAREKIWWLCHSLAHESRQLRRLKWQMKFLSCCFCLESVPSFNFELNLCCIMYIIQKKMGFRIVTSFLIGTHTLLLKKITWCWSFTITRKLAEHCLSHQMACVSCHLYFDDN